MLPSDPCFFHCCYVSKWIWRFCVCPLKSLFHYISFSRWIPCSFSNNNTRCPPWIPICYLRRRFQRNRWGPFAIAFLAMVFLGSLRYWDFIFVFRMLASCLIIWLVGPPLVIGMDQYSSSLFFFEFLSSKLKIVWGPLFIFNILLFIKNDKI